MKERLEAKLEAAEEQQQQLEIRIQKLVSALELLAREPGIEAIISANFDIGTDRY